MSANDQKNTKKDGFAAIFLCFLLFTVFALFYNLHVSGPALGPHCVFVFIPVGPPCGCCRLCEVDRRLGLRCGSVFPRIGRAEGSGFGGPTAKDRLCGVCRSRGCQFHLWEGRKLAVASDGNVCLSSGLRLGFGSPLLATDC